MVKDSENRLQLFQKMVQSVYEVSFWTFDASFQPISSNCAHAEEMIYLFSFEQEQIANLMVHVNANTISPVVLTNQLSMVWIVDFEPDDSDKIAFLHMIGPVFTVPQSLQSIKQRLFGMSLSTDLRDSFSSVIDNIPVIPLTHFLE